MRVRRFLAGAAVLLAVGAGSSAATAAPGYTYPPAFERAFLSSCKATSGGMSAPCRCALRWIERHYSYKQFVTIYLNNPKRTRTIMLQAVRACTR